MKAKTLFDANTLYIDSPVVYSNVLPAFIPIGISRRLTALVILPVLLPLIRSLPLNSPINARPIMAFTKSDIGCPVRRLITWSILMVLLFQTCTVLAGFPAWHLDTLEELVNERLDPVVSPNAIGSHLHDVAGGSGFGAAYNYETYVGIDDLAVHLLPLMHRRSIQSVPRPRSRSIIPTTGCPKCFGSTRTAFSHLYWLGGDSTIS